MSEGRGYLNKSKAKKKPQNPKEPNKEVQEKPKAEAKCDKGEDSGDQKKVPPAPLEEDCSDLAKMMAANKKAAKVAAKKGDKAEGKGKKEKPKAKPKPKSGGPGVFELPGALRRIGPKQIHTFKQFLPSMMVYSLSGFLLTVWLSDWKTVLQYMPYYGGKYRTKDDD